MFQQSQYTPVFDPYKGDPGVGIPKVEEGLIGGLVKSYVSTLTGGMVGGAGAEPGTVDRGSSVTGNTQAGPQTSTMPSQSTMPSFFDYATQRNPSLGLLNEGIESFSSGYHQGATSGGFGGGLMGGFNQIGTDLMNKGSNYTDKLQGLWGN